MQNKGLFGGSSNSSSIFGYDDAPKRSNKTLTLRQRLWLWEHARSQGLSKTCNICHKRITKFNDMELDHVRAASKGGKKLAMVHKDCNRMKSSGSLKEIQKRLGVKTRGTRKKTKRKRNYHYETDILGNRYKVRNSRNTGLFGY